MSDGPAERQKWQERGIKLPVSANERSNMSICDATGRTILYLGSANDKLRDEVIRAINGYAEAVKALRIIEDMNDWGGSSAARETLKDLGELND